MPGKSFVSILPENFVDAGVTPQGNLRWDEVRAAFFDYVNKAGEIVASTTAVRVKYVDDDGVEHVQHYSAGDKARFRPAEDGKSLVAVGTAENLNKSSNLFVLMQNLVNAGFPGDKLEEASGDLSKLDGLYTHNILIPEPVRPGLKREEPAEGARSFPKVISVPDVILRLPWEKKGKGATKPVAGKTATVKAGTGSEGETDSVVADAVKFVGRMFKEHSLETVTRAQLSQYLFTDKTVKAAGAEARDALAGALFGKEIMDALAAAGYTVDGEDISKTE